MNRLYFLVLLVGLMSCEKEKKVDYAILSGSISNPSAESITLYKGQEKLTEINLDDQGKFSDTIRNVSPGFLTLAHGRENTSLYVAPGHNLNLSLDTQQFDESISYSGEGSTANNYLAKKYLKNEELSQNQSEMFKMQEDSFYNRAGEIKQQFTSLLNDSENIDEDFIALEKKNIEYEYLAYLQNYPTYHAYYAQKPDFKASEGFLDPLENLDYTNDYDYENIGNYRQLVLNHYNKMIHDSENLNSTFQEVNKTASQQVKDDLSQNLAYEINPNNEHNEDYLNGITSLSSDQKLKDIIKVKYDKVQQLTKGKPSPIFTDYENHKGGSTSLTDLKGKYVYVDVWATWCGPCKVEIPYLKEVEKQYHGKNIVFVSTSIDKADDHNTWVQMVKDKELGGMQLMADNDWNSKFVTDYAIEGIPRFILIDPNGNIVTADAPRPSNPELVAMFESLDI
ncbi:Thiol-disulfide isomerase or thioredoxin [Flavobacteriaceae bacterium MAR_2010_188]|nr:Thiol-disulfide isomerase or thioredoxin [Flavobacteriaceae bacterium MAR_2010_188]